MTFKKGQGHQTRYELLDPEQEYDHANFEGPPLSSIRQKANVFAKSENMSVTSPEHVKKRKIVVYLLSNRLNNHTKFHLNWTKK